MSYRVSTKCLYGDGSKIGCDSSGAISVPIYQTATFVHPELGQSTGYDYTRLNNPTRENLENVVTSLEKGVRTFGMSSGMAAVALFTELFQSGDHIIANCDLYGGTIRLFNHISKKKGIHFEYIDTSADNIDSFIKENTKAIYIETPSNPMMNVTDIKKTALIAHENGLLLAVDNTFLSPYFQNPIELGADIVVHSGTKFLGGHNDTIAGFFVVGNEQILDDVYYAFKTTGSSLAPFDSWLILRGIKTLSIRMECQQKNSFIITEWLKNNSKVKKVHYIGLKEHPSYDISVSQTTGFGSMITFETYEKETAVDILKKVKLINFAESLGGTESLITYPTTQTHADMTEEERVRSGINDRTLRISVGIEDVNDLIEDLEQAFN